MASLDRKCLHITTNLKRRASKLSKTNSPFLLIKGVATLPIEIIMPAQAVLKHGAAEEEKELKQEMTAMDGDEWEDESEEEGEGA